MGCRCVKKFHTGRRLKLRDWREKFIKWSVFVKPWADDDPVVVPNRPVNSDKSAKEARF
jgi:hypothetical protein